MVIWYYSMALCYGVNAVVPCPHGRHTVWLVAVVMMIIGVGIAVVDGGGGGEGVIALVAVNTVVPCRRSSYLL